MAERTVLLMGLRGSGKSTLGQRLASALSRTFVDLDDRTVARLGCKTMTEVWRRFGEAGFREAESMALVEVLEKTPGHIIALGGGTPTAPGAHSIIKNAKECGTEVIYLRAAPETLRARLEASDITDRPSLTDASTLDEIEAVFHQRDELYTSLATVVLNTDDLDELSMHSRLRDLVP